MGDTSQKDIIKNESIVEYVGRLEMRICEMAGDSDIDVPIDPRIDKNIITEDDPDPKFVNVEVIRAGIISKTNRRRYNNNIVREINDLVVGVQGFEGHPDPSKEGFEFREPQCIFVGSMVDHMPDGLDRCIAKCYLFKSSKLREWIPKSIAAGKPMTVSINANGDIMRSRYDDIIDVVHISELMSIDWANPGTEGVYTSQAMSVVQEMQNKEGGTNMDGTNGVGSVMDTRNIISNVTVTELKAYNPNGYNDIIKGVTVKELQDLNPQVVQQIIDANKTEDVLLKVDGKEDTVKIRELQGIVDKLEGKIASMESDVQQAQIKEMKSRILSETVPDKYRDKIAGRITGDTEEDIKKSIETEIAYIREMGGGWDNQPVGRSQESGGDDIKESIAVLFGHKKAEDVGV